MVHNTSTGSQDDVTELTGWQKLDDPFLKVTELDVVTRRDDTGLVETAVELDDDLAVAVVVYFFELADVACQFSSCQRNCFEKGEVECSRSNKH